MSDIRYNQWLHNSGTGGVSQDAGGNIGIGTTAPLIPVGAGNTTILNVGVVTANYIYGTVQGAIEGTLDDWIVHAGDTNTKFGFPGTDQFSVETAGSERLRIKSNGFVGIGTDNPTRVVHVQDDSNTLLSLDSTDSNADLVQSDTSGSTRIRSASGALEFFLGGDASSTNATGSGKKLTISSAGKVGIGEDNPSYHTEIKMSSTDAYSSSTLNSGQHQLRVNNAGLSGVAGILLTAEPSSGSAGHAGIRVIAPANGSADMTFSTRNASTYGEKVRITAAGKVGIGITNPAEKFQVNGGNIAITGGSSYKIDTHPLVSYASFSDISGGSYAARLGSTGSSTIRSTQIYGGGSHIATFDGVNNRLGINQTTPAVELDIKATTPEIRLTCSNQGLGQGETIGQLGWYTTDPTTPTGAGTVSYINTYSATSNGSDYTTAFSNRAGAGGGETKIALGNALGQIRFYTHPSAGGTERMRIDKDGNVTKPYQPGFCAYANNLWQPSGTGDIWITSSFTKQFDTGNDFDTSNNTFTAPVAGRYMFHFGFRHQFTQGGYVWVYLKKNGSSFSNMHVTVPQTSANMWHEAQAIFGIMSLAANDEIRPQISVNYAGVQMRGLQFSGYLLG